MYCMPGLGANPKIFKNISFPENRFELHYLEWKIPLSVDETLENYAYRMSKEIKHKKPVLLGVSFGGILSQEIAKIIPVHKLILISTVKTCYELPTRLRLIQMTNAYKLFPLKIVENLDEYKKYFLGDFLKKRAELYEMYLSVKDATYMKWALYNVLHWQQKTPPNNYVHIHGNNDHVFPSKHLKDFILIEKGTHIMILQKATLISEIICKNLT